MRKILLSVALACVAFATPAHALADTAMGHDAMAGPSSTAIMICRHAATNEKPMAMTMDASKTGLICKALPEDMMAKVKAKNAGPDLSKALSSQQADDVWRQWLAQVFTIPVTGGG